LSLRKQAAGVQAWGAWIPAWAGMTGKSGLDTHIEVEGCQAGSAVTLAGKENPLPPEWQRYIHAG